MAGIESVQYGSIKPDFRHTLKQPLENINQFYLFEISIFNSCIIPNFPHQALV